MREIRADLTRLRNYGAAESQRTGHPGSSNLRADDVAQEVSDIAEAVNVVDRHPGPAIAADRELSGEYLISRAALDEAGRTGERVTTTADRTALDAAKHLHGRTRDLDASE